ncbi:hypothetical protein PO909_032430 [Leuciscus waleckii]
MLVLQHAEASPPLSERSALRIQPLAIHADAWAKLPGVSKWVLNIIERGYSLQFRRRPRRYVARVETTVKTEVAHLLRAEVTKLLSKGAIEPLSQVQSEGGLYSRYFLVPKKDGGLRPILDLRQLNKVLVKRQFRMLTTRQILVQIRQGDWFVSIDLKDAYFQIQIASRHRRYLRFAFEGQAYQYTVLPFGLSLAPRTFTKCMDAALAPLRMRGVRVLNYLDDWLILAQSRAVLIEHTTILLDHLEDLGLSVNWAKSSLSPSQKISFLGTELDSLSMIARLSQQRAVDIRRTANSFRCGASVPLKRFQKMLGLMASASSVLQLGLLRMRPLQFWLKARVPREAWAPGTVLEKPTLVPSRDAVSEYCPVASTNEERSPLTGPRLDLASSPGTMVPSCLGHQRVHVGLPKGVLNTITQARAPSTRRLYSSKWSVFSGWCTARGVSPTNCGVTEVLSFLQELLDGGRAPSTLKVYVAAIAAFSETTLGQSIGRNDLRVKGAKRLNPPRPPSVPVWDLSTVLEAMKGAPFEPLQSIDLKHLSFKTVFLLALASVKRIGDLHALSVSAACMEFGPNDSKVILKPKHGYVPKSLNTPFRAQVISLSALPVPDEEKDASLLCPVRALRAYVSRSSVFRQTEQLFVSFSGRSKGLAASKQSLSRWIVDAIALAYASKGMQCPLGVRAHSTRGMASSWAWSSGIALQDICMAAGWASPSTFIRFYNLEVPALQARLLSV